MSYQIGTEVKTFPKLLFANVKAQISVLKLKQLEAKKELGNNTCIKNKHPALEENFMNT